VNSNIAIEINGEFIDLSSSSLRLEKVNPFFIQDVYQGDFSFPFDLPLTEKNLRIFKHVDSPEINNRITSFTCVLYIFGVPYSKSKLTITKASSKLLNAVLSGGIKSFSSIDKKISEIDLGKDFNLGNTREDIAAMAQSATENGDWKTYPFAFIPYYAPNFYGSLNADFNGVVNRVDPTTGNIHTNNPSGSLKSYSLAPWIYLFHILDCIFKAEKLTPSGDFWSNEECNKMILLGNRALEIRPRDQFTRVQAVDEQLFNSDNQVLLFQLNGMGTWDNIQGFDDTTGEYTIKRSGKFVFRFNLMVNGFNDAWYINNDWVHGGEIVIEYDGVDVYTSSPIDHTSEPHALTLGYELTATSGDIGKVIFLKYKASKQKGTPFARVYGDSTFDVTINANALPPVPDSILKIKEHVPDVTVGELLTEIKKLGVMIDVNFNLNTVALNTTQSLLSRANITDYTSRFNPDMILNFEDSGKGILISYKYNSNENVLNEIDQSRYVGTYFHPGEFPTASKEGEIVVSKLTNEVYRAVVDVSTNINWEFIGHLVSNFKIGNGESTISCSLAPVLMTIANNEGGTAYENSALMPFYPGSGSSDLYGLGLNPPPLRFAFWRGINQMGNRFGYRGGLYVLASSGTVGINDTHDGKIDADLSKANCLVRTNSEKLYLAMNESVMLEADWYPDPIDVYNMESFQKLIIANDLYITKNNSFSISNRGVTAKATLLKL
jgi:hypothetical protein